METTWTHQLRAVGLRVTRPRLAVLHVLAEHPHADADTIVTAARVLHPSLSPQAVYGVLRALVSTGLARRIEPAGAPALFELRAGDNHPHLVCGPGGPPRFSGPGSATTPPTWSAARVARSPMSTASWEWPRASCPRTRRDSSWTRRRSSSGVSVVTVRPPR